MLSLMLTMGGLQNNRRSRRASMIICPPRLNRCLPCMLSSRIPYCHNTCLSLLPWVKTARVLGRLATATYRPALLHTPTTSRSCPLLCSKYVYSCDVFFKPSIYIRRYVYFKYVGISNQSKRCPGLCSGVRGSSRGYGPGHHKLGSDKFLQSYLAVKYYFRLVYWWKLKEPNWLGDEGPLDHHPACDLVQRPQLSELS